MARRRPLLIGAGVLGGVVGVAALGLGGTLWWLTTDAGNDWIGRQAIAAVDVAVPGQIAVGSLRTNVLRHLTLGSVEFRDPEGVPLIEVEELTIRYDLGALLRRRVVVEAVSLTGVHLELAPLPDGQLNLLGALGIGPPEEGEAEPPSEPWGGIGDWVVEVGQLTVTDASVRYTDDLDPEQPTEVVVHGGSLDVHRIEVSGRTAALPSVTLRAHVDAPLDTPVAARGGLTLHDGTLTIDQLGLHLQESQLKVSGHVASVETRPVLDLEIHSPAVVAAELERLTGEPVLQTDLALTGALSGSLADLSGAVEARSEATGALDLEATANLDASPVAWSLAFVTPGFDLQALLPGISEPVQIDGEWRVDGSGTRWPDELEASFCIRAREPVLWGEPIRDLQLEGAVAGGLVTLTSASAAHPVGRLRLDGSVHVEDANALLEARVELPTVAALSRYGLDGAGGSARFDGTVRLDWAAEDLQVQASGQLSGAGLTLAEPGLSIGQLQTPLVLKMVGARGSASGVLAARAVSAPAVELGELRLPDWRVSWSEDAAASLEADLDASALSVGDGAVTVQRVLGTLAGGSDAAGEPFAEGDVVISDLLLGSGAVEAEGGPVQLTFAEDAVRLRFDLARKAAPFFEGRVSGDLGTGAWRIEDLVLAPLSDSPWRSTAPVTFGLSEGGVEDLELVMSSEGGRIEARGSWLGATAEGTDLQLAASGLELETAGRILDTYLPPAPGAAGPLEGVTGTVAVRAALADGSAVDGAQLHVEVEGAGLSYPGALTDARLLLTVDGALARPEAHAELRSSADDVVLSADGVVPLVLDGGLPADVLCGDEARLRLLLPAGGFRRLEGLVPDLDLPGGRASAELLASGDPCNPDLRLTGALEVEAGARGERVRLDVLARRVGEHIDVEALAFEALEKRVEVRGSAETQIAAVLDGLRSGDPTAPDPALVSSWVDELDLSVVPTALPLSTLGMVTGLPSGVSGILGGGLNIAGSPVSPTVSGALMLVDGQVGAVPVEQAQLLVYPWADATTGAPGYRLESHLAFGPSGEEGGLDVVGYLPLGLDLDLGEDQELTRDGLRLAVSGAGIPLEMAVGVLPGVPEAAGMLQIEGAVEGSLADPIFDASARIEDGHLHSEDLGLIYRDIRLDLAANPRRFSVNQLQWTSEPLYPSLLGGKPDPGRISVAGVVLLEDLAPQAVQLHLKADRFWLAATGDTLLQANGAIDATGTWPALRVGGSAELVRGRMAFDEDFFREGSSLKLDPVLTVHRERAIRARPVEPPSELLRQLELDLEVDLHRGFSLLASVPTADDYGQQAAELLTLGVDIELMSPAGLRLQMLEGEPALNGTLELSRGKLDVMGRSFDVSGGAVSFVSDVSDPILDISAVYRTGNYGDITVGVAGTASEPDLAFTSDQYPDKTDVMAILVLGKPPSELSQSEGQMGGELLGMALSSVANNLSRTVSTAFLGQIEFDGSSFKVGMPLARDLFAAMELRSTEDEDENSLEVTLEWLLSRRFSAELVTGDAAQTSADVYYRWRF